MGLRLRRSQQGHLGRRSTTCLVRWNDPFGLWWPPEPVLIIVLFVLCLQDERQHLFPRGPAVVLEQPARPIPGCGTAAGFGFTKGRTVAAKHPGKATIQSPRYLRSAEVADILHVAPKTVSRWAKEGKLPFLRTLGGHRRYPEAEIRQLANQLRQEATA
jgi:excisionase family DNA binding protein